MWTWPFDESQQTLVIAILGFIGAFLLIHYYLSFRSRRTEINRFSSHDFIESVLSQYSAKFAAATKIMEDITLRLEFVERALQQTQLLSSSKSKALLTSTNKFDNLSLLSNLRTNEQDENSGIGDTGDISDISNDIRDAQSKNNITKLHEIQSDDYENSGNITNMSAFILKLLSKKSMNTIEIQSKVRRTREHTSRFMKTLSLQGLVSREMHTKPFVYTLTDEGRKQLKAFHNDV